MKAGPFFNTNIAAAFVTAVCLSQCKIVEDKYSGSTLSMEDFRITNEIQGWSQAEGGYAFYASEDELFDIINGGADLYKDFGMREGIYQKMLSGDKNYEALIMDFGTESRARAIFEYKKFEITKTLKIGDYFEDTVIGDGDDIGTRISAYAYFNQYYIEISPIEGADRRQHLLDADLFLGHYKKKADDQKCIE
jgi:hypothetical protein